MKLSILVSTLFGLSMSAFAGQIDRDLQAIILNAAFPKAVEAAKNAIPTEGTAYVLTLGETTHMNAEGPIYYYSIPVSIVQVPLSPVHPKLVGYIVAKLEVAMNTPLPGVVAVYFNPVRQAPIKY